jgi:transposase
MAIYRISDADEQKLRAWAEENNIQIEELDSGNYSTACPKCGDNEFWHNGECGHCGFMA